MCPVESWIWEGITGCCLTVPSVEMCFFWLSWELQYCSWKRNTVVGEHNRQLFLQFILLSCHVRGEKKKMLNVCTAIACDMLQKSLSLYLGVFQFRPSLRFKPYESPWWQQGWGMFHSPLRLGGQCMAPAFCFCLSSQVFNFFCLVIIKGTNINAF